MDVLAHAPSKSLIVEAADPLTIRDLLPKSKLLKDSKFTVAVKHTIESTRVLRNLGYDAPAPIVSQYVWPGKYKPFQHQYTIADFCTMNRRLFNLSDPGVGKTASSLWAADWLMSTGRVRKALIAAPLSTLERVWQSDIFDVLMHRKAVVVHGPAEKRLQLLESDSDFYIINHDGLSISRIKEYLAKRADIDLIIVDEASMFRNASTRKYKALKDVIRPDQRLWLLTGTPCPNEPTDAWALAKMVQPSSVPRTFGQFRRQTMTQLTPFKWAPRPNAYTLAYEALQPAVRFRKGDCLDLPPVVTLNRQATLSVEQQEAAQTMRKYMQTTTAAGQTITAVNAADQINKMRQIFCGVVRDPMDPANYLPLDFTPRAQVLMECVQEAAAKVLIIVPFKGIIRKLEDTLRQRYSVGVLNGDVSIRQRDAIIRNFKETDDPHVLLCHPKVMAHGLNLTEADMLIFYAPIYSNDEFQQVTERFNRAGQKRTMTIYRIAAHPLEWEIYRLVDERKMTQDAVLALYKSLIA